MQQNASKSPGTHMASGGMTGAGTAPNAGSTMRTGSTNDSGSSQGDLAGQAKDVANNLVDLAKSKASSRLAPEIDNACQNLTGTASAIRSFSSQLRDQELGDYAKYVDQAADQLESVSRFLDGKNLDDLVWETEQFARRQPAFFIGGAMALGFLASRFFKATTPRPEMPGYNRSYESYRAATYRSPRPMYTPSNQPAHYGGGMASSYGQPTMGRSTVSTSGSTGSAFANPTPSATSPTVNRPTSAARTNDVPSSGDASAEMTGSSSTADPGFNTQSGRR